MLRAGWTRREVLKLIFGTVKLHIDALRESGQSVPEPTSRRPSMTSHPFRIWFIAGVYGAASTLAVWYAWPNTDLPELPDISELVVTMCLAILPGLLGLLLIRGKRWVRWLFVLVIPLVAAAAFVAMLGNAMQGAPKDSPETVWLWGFFLVTVASTVVVFRYFAHESKG
jgi:peptidoglycan/LPS O-acetylase OafA/YrhL